MDRKEFLLAREEIQINMGDRRELPMAFPWVMAGGLSSIVLKIVRTIIFKNKKYLFQTILMIFLFRILSLLIGRRILAFSEKKASVK